MGAGMGKKRFDTVGAAGNREKDYGCQLQHLKLFAGFRTGLAHGAIKISFWSEKGKIFLAGMTGK
jgi:hypothetical protein